jgi:hypothetical protein
LVTIALIAAGACRGLYGTNEKLEIILLYPSPSFNNVVSACHSNSRPIGDGSCRNEADAMNCGDVEGDCDSYKGACRENKGQIGMGSCTAVNACCRNNATIGNVMCTEAGSCSNCGAEATPTGSPTYFPSYYPTASPNNKVTRTYVPSQSPLMF